MNTSKVENYRIVVIKPGVYYKSNMGQVEFTDDPSKAYRFAIDDFQGSSRVAKQWFGEVKTMKVITEVE